MKHGPFSGMDRPSAFKEQLGNLHWVEGLQLNVHFSFPSGHTAAVYSMCLASTVLVGRKGWGVWFALLAALIAYSRVYLNQHFALDIWAGNVIGSAVTWSTYYFLYRSRYSDPALGCSRLGQQFGGVLSWTTCKMPKRQSALRRSPDHHGSDSPFLTFQVVLMTNRPSIGDHELKIILPGIASVGQEPVDQGFSCR